ncbi:MAG: hypothetical protein P9X24_02665 [Candidatus Hatepunaea meridiana]|nr:hypothetical protein [Candidatus Hatepunaea meridiana]
MGRFIALILVFYFAFAFSRFFLRLFGVSKSTTDSRKPEKESTPPWNKEDVMDADYEDIK